jgi:hypothetical protein
LQRWLRWFYRPEKCGSCGTAATLFLVGTQELFVHNSLLLVGRAEDEGNQMVAFNDIRGLEKKLAEAEKA